jgi:ABC-type bacteriocin/lantibiotic exporter with double-glycine peptidase domain
VADLQIAQSLPSRILEVFGVLGLFLLLFINRFTSNSTFIDITTIGAFMGATYKIIPGVVKIFNFSAQIKTYEFTLKPLLEKTPNLSLIHSDQNISSISFREVFFYYHEQAFLENFDFSIKKGEIIGISGKSGKGKTTIINLLLGFLSQHEGKILFNDEIVSAEERRSFWHSVSYVKQQTFLLHDTILNNIILNDKQFNKERFCFAIEAAGLNKFIDQYDEGIQKVITEKGKNISGGQQQRIAIARAIYKDADLLIMDEPFSALDDASMRNIMQHLKQLARSGKLVLLISHNQKSLSF